MVKQACDRKRVNPLALLAMVWTCLLGAVHAAGVETELSHDTLSVGEGAQLTLTISGKAAGRPEFPAVENLVLRSAGQSQNIQMFNGHTTVSTTYTYVVGSNVAGTYQIPAIDMMIDGEPHTTRALTLTVKEDGAPAPPLPGQQPQGQEPAEETGEQEFGFLTVELANSDRKHAYVGEIAPVRIRAWLPLNARAQLHNGIQPEGKGFTLHNVTEQPRQTQEERDGKNYLVVTWFGGISATRAGQIPVSLSVDATVAVPDKSAPKTRRGGPFDDPVFGSLFDTTPMVEKQVTLKSEDEEIEVRALPTEGKPEGFSGAVGDFKFDSANIPGGWTTGEPQQITTQLSGSGNFSLMKAPLLTPAEAWKSYPGKDQFRAHEETSFSGSKIFQFNAVPRKGGDQDVSLSFSYFEPDAGVYKTIASPVQKIRVTGEDVAEEKPAATPAAKEPEKKKSGDLVAQHRGLSPAATLEPLVSRRAFKEMLGTSAGLCLLGAGLAVVRRRRSDPRRTAKAALAKDTREALDQAGAARDAVTFFAAGRLAIQRQLGALWSQPPQAITTSEVRGRLTEESPVTRFFREADVLEYSRSGSGEVQPQWRALLDEALASLTPSTR